ncbi:MAG TPA: ferritin-like domain-containing protein [Puia sp.]|jgi:ferritin-like metal-binding protein YciE|nr:ferritin-like domain-containing protein [Puia sp.]
MPTVTSKSKETQSRLREFFIEQLQDIYWAEQKLVKALPKMANAAHSAELREAFNNHLEETRQHVTRIEQAFRMMNEVADTQECQAIKGILKEGEDIIDETEDETAQRDVGLIFAGQKAEHYEIATYGGLVQLAKTMGQSDVAGLLAQTLAEEKAADQKLTEIAETHSNEAAAKEKSDRQ